MTRNKGTVTVRKMGEEAILSWKEKEVQPFCGRTGQSDDKSQHNKASGRTQD
jgi:hypothetical protein